MRKNGAHKVCPRCHGAGYLHDYADLGERMRGLREKADFSRAFVAKRMKITEGNLSDMERGDRPWTPDQITKFIDAIS